MKTFTRICTFIFIGIITFSCGESIRFDDPIDTSSSNTEEIKKEEKEPSTPTNVITVKINTQWKSQSL